MNHFVLWCRKWPVTPSQAVLHHDSPTPRRGWSVSENHRISIPLKCDPGYQRPMFGSCRAYPGVNFDLELHYPLRNVITHGVAALPVRVCSTSPFQASRQWDTRLDARLTGRGPAGGGSESGRQKMNAWLDFPVALMPLRFSRTPGLSLSTFFSTSRTQGAPHSAHTVVPAWKARLALMHGSTSEEM